MKTSFLFAGSLALFISGCFTVSETEFPETSTTPPPAGKNIRVKLQNFRTGVYHYVSVEGHETITPGVTPSERQVPSPNDNSGSIWVLSGTASGNLVNRVMDELRVKGYTLDRKNPDYVIEMIYSGPTFPDNDVLSQVLYGVCTILTAENTAVTWTAKLNVRDGATDDVLFTKDYTQDYAVTVWGPVPIFSPAFNPKITCYAANSWALTALTDTAIMDATKFIADKAK